VQEPAVKISDPHAEASRMVSEHPNGFGGLNKLSQEMEELTGSDQP